MTDVAQTKPFYLTPSPYRAPAIILWLAALVIGIGAPLVGYAFRFPFMALQPLLILLLAALLVGACASIAGKNLSNARTLLYVATAAVIALAGWMTFNDFRISRGQSVAEARLASDLTALCREHTDGQVLADPECARYLAVLDTYYLRDAAPPEPDVP